MPSCTQEVQEAIDRMFPDTEDLDGEAWRYLHERGWVERRFVLTPPKSIEEVSDEEYDCLLYLVQEWDWGYEPYKTEQETA